MPERSHTHLGDVKVLFKDGGWVEFTTDAEGDVRYLDSTGCEAYVTAGEAAEQEASFRDLGFKE